MDFVGREVFFFLNLVSLAFIFLFYQPTHKILQFLIIIFV